MKRNYTAGERIKKCRKERKMTTEKLTIISGYRAKSTISCIETGVRSPTVDAVERIARALDVNPAWLCGWDTRKERNSDG